MFWLRRKLSCMCDPPSHGDKKSYLQHVCSGSWPRRPAKNSGRASNNEKPQHNQTRWTTWWAEYESRAFINLPFLSTTPEGELIGVHRRGTRQLESRWMAEFRALPDGVLVLFCHNVEPLWVSAGRKVTHSWSQRVYQSNGGWLSLTLRLRLCRHKKM